MKRKTLLSLILIGVLVLALGIGTYAWYTSSANANGQRFTAGRLTVSVDGIATGEAGHDTTANFQIGNMQPGDITPWYTIKVTNTGTLPAAVFGRFTMSGTTALFNDLSFYDYKVNYFKNGGTPVARWNAVDYDPYFGTAINEDWFIKDGECAAFKSYNGTDNVAGWINGMGPLDFMVNGESWDMEGVGAKGYYIVSFRLKYNEGAEIQGQSAVLGYEVKATQVNQKALTAYEKTLGVAAGSLAGQEGYISSSAAKY